MNVLGHYDITKNLEAVVSASEFQRIKEPIFGTCCCEISLAAITAEGDKVVVAFLLITLEAQRHWIDSIDTLEQERKSVSRSCAIGPHLAIKPPDMGHPIVVVRSDAGHPALISPSTLKSNPSSFR